MTAFAFVACKTEDTTHMPPLPTNEITIPPSTTEAPPAPTTTVAQSGDHSCSPAGMELYCGNPVWFGLPKCGPGSSDGNIYFLNKSAMVSLIKSIPTWDSCVWIDGKPIAEVSGFGPCLPCASRVSPSGLMKMFGAEPSFPEVDRDWKPGKEKVQ
jgi:hypothetical protein